MTHPLAELDHRFVWHPFTQMRDWLKREPIVIVRGRGTVLYDAHGKEYLDANSSIWTNLHGHNHPHINRAIRNQLQRIAHSSALGFANEPASLLAERLVTLANPADWKQQPQKRVTGVSKVAPVGPARGAQNRPMLSKVFFSDDGSTALEVALKLAFEFARRRGRNKNPRFLGLQGGYHGDTIGAVSLGHIDLFHAAYSPLLFRTDKVMAPYCYRCPFNKAKPERADAREYRKCNWECVDLVEQKFATQNRKGRPYAGFVFEPRVQGAAGIIPQPVGWLSRVCQIARAHGALLIADEVMTGFGRTGMGLGERETVAVQEMLDGPPTRTHLPSHKRRLSRGDNPPRLFASHQEGVQPDFINLAKGLTGGYVPMAATLTTQAVFDAFLGNYEEFKTFFHGHSFTGNQVGATAALASLSTLQAPTCIRARRQLEQLLHKELKALWRHPQVGDIRQVGLIAGVELVKDWRTREPIELRKRAGIRACDAMARHGVLTRPIGNVVVLMPPYCTTASQIHQMVDALSYGIAEEFGSKAARGQT